MTDNTDKFQPDAVETHKLQPSTLATPEATSGAISTISEIAQRCKAILLRMIGSEKVEPAIASLSIQIERLDGLINGAIQSTLIEEFGQEGPQLHQETAQRLRADLETEYGMPELRNRLEVLQNL